MAAADQRVGALALLVVVFAIGQTEDDSVRNLLTATKAYAAPHKIKLAKLTHDTHRSTQLAMLNRLSHMNPKQQMLYDEGMEGAGCALRLCRGDGGNPAGGGE